MAVAIKLLIIVIGAHKCSLQSIDNLICIKKYLGKYANAFNAILNRNIDESKKCHHGFSERHLNRMGHFKSLVVRWQFVS